MIAPNLYLLRSVCAVLIFYVTWKYSRHHNHSELGQPYPALRLPTVLRASMWRQIHASQPLSSLALQASVSQLAMLCQICCRPRPVLDQILLILFAFGQ